MCQSSRLEISASVKRLLPQKTSKSSRNCRIPSLISAQFAHAVLKASESEFYSVMLSDVQLCLPEIIKQCCDVFSAGLNIKECSLCFYYL